MSVFPRLSGNPAHAPRAALSAPIAWLILGTCLSLVTAAGAASAAENVPVTTEGAVTDIASLGDITLTVWDQEVRGGQNEQMEQLNAAFTDTSVALGRSPRVLHLPAGTYDITAGSVDDGKSTLIGRLLYDSKQIFQDQMDAIEEASRRGLVQSPHGSCSVMLPQHEHARTRSATSSSERASRRMSSGGRLSRW